MAVLDSEATMLFYSPTGRSEISTMLRLSIHYYQRL